jgi:tetratricopeptide (TPR) repeat protein
VNIVLIAVLLAALGAEPEVKTRVEKTGKGKAALREEMDPTTKAYEKLLEKDEAALQEIEKIIAEFEAFEAKGAAGPRGVMIAKIEGIIDGIKKDYEEFLQHHSKHVEGYIAYGSFLNEVGDEEGATKQWEKARELEPMNPTPWNNLANIFGHIGPVKKAFQYYEKAIELNPKEPVYIQNLATTTYLFRKDAAETYRIDEEGVFNKALDLYRQAMKLDPTNLVLATDYAQSYYGIKPLRTNDAIRAWDHCLTLAKSDVEKQGIHLHLARVKWMSGMLDEAEEELKKVTAPSMEELRDRIQRNIEKKRDPEKAEPGNGKNSDELTEKIGEEKVSAPR